MRTFLRLPLAGLCLLGLMLAGASPSVVYGDEQVGPWNLTQLHQTPEFRWVDQTGPVHSLLYAGEDYQGKPTEVFAFYASPKTLGKAAADETFPGVVLIHGGGGTAFAEWVYLWAERGYAAIAMDLGGDQPKSPEYDEKTGRPVPNHRADGRTRLTNGGPNQGHPEKFDSIGGDVSDDWPFHAVASSVRAHSLLRSFPEVQSDRTGVTGISWGGYTTCLVASVDDRFCAAVPVYGCGFLHEGESVQKPAIDRLGDRRELWVQQYDPGSWLTHCRVPILFVNGTNDVHYPLDSYQKSFEAVPSVRQMRIQVKMGHSHPAGWAPAEIGLFIDSYCKPEAGYRLPQPGELNSADGTVSLSYISQRPLAAAALYYTTDTGLRSKRNWNTVKAEIQDGRVTVAAPPASANTWFVTLTDDQGAMASTPVQFQ